MAYFAIITRTHKISNGTTRTVVSAYGGQQYGKGFATEAVALANTRRALSGMYPGARFDACQFEDFAEAKEYAALIQPN